jgi:hypothetical protein
VVRVVETSGRGGPASISLPAWSREVTFEIQPFEIRTFRIPRDPHGGVVETDLLERPLGDRPDLWWTALDEGNSAPDTTADAAGAEREPVDEPPSTLGVTTSDPLQETAPTDPDADRA